MYIIIKNYIYFDLYMFKRRDDKLIDLMLVIVFEMFIFVGK